MASKEKYNKRPKEVKSFKYLGSEIANEGFKPEIYSSIAQTTDALSRLKPIWREKNISLASKYKMIWTLSHPLSYMCVKAELERRIQALQMRCYRRILNITYKDHVTNDMKRLLIRSRMQSASMKLSFS